MAAAAARKSPTKRLARRTPEWVRPYLTRTETVVLVSALEELDSPDKLLDPSIASALTELKRALAQS